MSTEIKNFQFKSTDGAILADVRTLEIDNKPYFVAKDVATALGYAKTRNAINRHCKLGDALKRGVPSISGIQDYTMITEGDVYRLIFNSKLEAAQEFEKWVMDDLLPKLRKGEIVTSEKLSPAEYMFEQAKFMLEVERKQNDLCKP